MGKFNHWLQIYLFMYNIGMSVFKLSQYIVLMIAALGVVKIIILNCTAVSMHIAIYYNSIVFGSLFVMKIICSNFCFSVICTMI